MRLLKSLVCGDAITCLFGLSRLAPDKSKIAALAKQLGVDPHRGSSLCSQCDDGMCWCRDLELICGFEMYSSLCLFGFMIYILSQPRLVLLFMFCHTPLG